MKKRVILIAGLMLTACASQQPAPQAPLDMASVAAYQQKVYSGNTVPMNERHQAQQPVDMPMNASDSQSKTRPATVRPNIILMPSIGYHYGHYHW